MDRKKALALLREILDVSKQTDINSITLNRDNLGNFSLKIKCAMDEALKSSLKPILARDRLEVKQEGDFLVIHSAES